MKRVLFCFIVLLAFSLSANSLGNRVKHTFNSGAAKIALPFQKEKLQKGCGNYLHINGIDLTDDDTNDTEEKTVSLKPLVFVNPYLISSEFNNLRINSVYYNRYFSAQHLPYFILLRVLRI